MTEEERERLMQSFNTQMKGIGAAGALGTTMDIRKEELFPYLPGFVMPGEEPDPETVSSLEEILGYSWVDAQGNRMSYWDRLKDLYGNQEATIIRDSYENMSIAERMAFEKQFRFAQDAPGEAVDLFVDLFGPKGLGLINMSKAEEYRKLFPADVELPKKDEVWTKPPTNAQGDPITWETPTLPSERGEPGDHHPPIYSSTITDFLNPINDFFMSMIPEEPVSTYTPGTILARGGKHLGSHRISPSFAASLPESAKAQWYTDDIGRKVEPRYGQIWNDDGPNTEYYYNDKQYDDWYKSSEEKIRTDKYFDDSAAYREAMDSFNDTMDFANRRAANTNWISEAESLGGKEFQSLMDWEAGNEKKWNEMLLELRNSKIGKDRDPDDPTIVGPPDASHFPGTPEFKSLAGFEQGLTHLGRGLSDSMYFLQNSFGENFRNLLQSVRSDEDFTSSPNQTVGSYYQDQGYNVPKSPADFGLLYDSLPFEPSIVEGNWAVPDWVSPE